MTDPVRGLGEMGRVTRKDGVVAACVWDHAGGQGPLKVFWDAARSLDPDVDDESWRAGTREGHLAQLFQEAGLRQVEQSVLEVGVDHSSFEEWWEPFELGVGPAGLGVMRAAPAVGAAILAAALTVRPLRRSSRSGPAISSRGRNPARAPAAR